MEITSKAVSDKADMGCVMTRVNDKVWNTMVPNLRIAVNEGILKQSFLEDLKPTHIIDIYKMRRGRYKNVRIWIKLHLGTGYREDLFMTTMDNQPIREVVDLFPSAVEVTVPNWKEELNND